MTRFEFAKIMAYVTAGCGKPLPEASLEVYFDLLGDLPEGVLLTAVKRVLVEHVWATFPSVAELRQAAAETIGGTLKPLSSAEAWRIAWESIGCRYDPERSGPYQSGGKLFNNQLDALIDGLNPLVVEAARSFGFVALACAEPNFARPQFIKIFDALAARESRKALMPPAVKESVKAIGAEREQSKAIGMVKGIAAAIGVEKDAD